jgi:hypothetical protein
MHVDVLAEELADRFHHARMASELGEGIAVQVRGEIGAHRLAGLLAHVFRAPLRVQARHLLVQDPDLLAAEEAGEKQVTFAIELRELLWRKFHGRRKG